MNFSSGLSKISPFLILICFWLAAEFLVNPTGSFPLNDDWNYAVSVKSLLDGHGFTFSCWSLAASLTQIIIGYFFSLFTGFSFFSLRISTLCLGFAGAIATYFLVGQYCKNNGIKILSAALLLANPLYFELSNTFMTDVPFTALSALLVLIFGTILKEPAKTNKHIIAACILSVLICLLRQTGIIIVIAYAIACAINKIKSKSCYLPLPISILAMGAFEIWHKYAANNPYSYMAEEAFIKARFSQGLLFFIHSSIFNLFTCLIYIGLFILPILPCFLPGIMKKLDNSDRRFLLFFCIVITVTISALLVAKGMLLPLADNIFFNFGLGPIFCGAQAVNWPSASLFLLAFLTICGAAGGTILAALIIMFNKRQTALNSENDPRLSFYLLICFIFLSIICLRGYFDRYLILLIPILLAWLAGLNKDQSITKPALLSSILAIGIFAAFAIVGTHDYFSYNRARWQMLDFLTQEEKIPALKIDGGLEFNGWYAYQNADTAKSVVLNTSMTHDQDYLVTLKPVSGYSQIKSIQFDHWLAQKPMTVYALKKN